ncbi:hypothetical protein [Kitasatospora purpeofusca]|uniref:hypothetical protein n=1 Tax=Kitasatospora purpeofusca TaxID=67352 RepID=UPI0036D34E04
MQREIAKRLPNHLVRHRPRAQQTLELVGGGDLEDTEHIGPQDDGRAVRAGGATSVRGPVRPGRLGRAGGRSCRPDRRPYLDAPSGGGHQGIRARPHQCFDLRHYRRALPNHQGIGAAAGAAVKESPARSGTAIKVPLGAGPLLATADAAARRRRSRPLGHAVPAVTPSRAVRYLGGHTAAGGRRLVGVLEAAAGGRRGVGARSYDHRVPDAFTVLWTHDVCRALRRAGRTGQRPPVAFSGVHTSLPAWSGAQAGDEVYAVHVSQRVVHVVSRMRIIDRARGTCCGSAPAGRGEPAFPGHGDWSMLGADGCGAQVVHVEATPVRFDLPVPGGVLAELSWRNRQGRTRQLKYVVDGLLERSISLQGFYRLTPESADELAGIVDAAAV